MEVHCVANLRTLPKALHKVIPETVVERWVQRGAKARASEIPDVGRRLQEDVDQLGAPADGERRDLWLEDIRPVAEIDALALRTPTEITLPCAKRAKP